jgi:hypothetical protein
MQLDGGSSRIFQAYDSVQRPQKGLRIFEAELNTLAGC